MKQNTSTKQNDADDPDVEKVTVSVPRELADRIKTFWHKRQFNNRSATWRHLLEKGLEAEAEGQKR
jgi:metal-responsive CopG/Arc/MetJ family transcriptional regulator